MSQKNNLLEMYVADKLKKIDKRARPTKASGASTEVGDILNSYIYAECKQQLTTDHPKINRNTWYKLVSETPRADKVPVLFLENKQHDRFAVLNVDVFFDLMYKLYNV